MKRFTVIVIAAVVCVSLPNPSQSGKIALSGTPDGSDCSVIDTGPGVIQVHIVITDIDNVAGVQFWAPTPECWTGAVWMEDNIPYPTFIGDTQNDFWGLTIGLGDCLNSPIYLGSMSFLTQGQGAPCCDYPILKANNDGYPEIEGPIIAVCPEPLQVAGVTVDAIINPEPECACQLPVPVQETTWGAVKALYR
jgi:hypothetical protein